MADFNLALPIVLRHEGGFSNNENDVGGPTSYGISAQLLSAYLGQHVSVDQMKVLTLEEAGHIYKKLFWDTMSLDFISNQNLAAIIFDQSVLNGVPLAVQFIQEILNLPVDKILGSHTVDAINSYVSATWLSAQFIYRCQKHFIEICETNHTQDAFLLGWISRSQNLLDLLIDH